MHTAVLRVVATLLLVATSARATSASASEFEQATADKARSRLLDVPFVPQSEALCGGAAVAMVMRYWSAAATVHAEDFAALVDPRAGGIAVGALKRAVDERGWRALAFAPDAADVQAHVGDGRPVIALIEDRPQRFHYVVVVAWTSDRVVFHDPAVNPFRSMDIASFDRAWRAATRTALLVLPGETPVPPAVTPAVTTAPATEREQAGSLFMRKRYSDAASLAALAVERDPADVQAWQLLAAARYLEGDTGGALDAWNERHEPRVDLARVDGLDRTRYDVVSSVLDLPSKTVLTRRALQRAERRVAAMPTAQASRVSYSPRENGTATVDVAVVERPLLPRTRTDVLAVAVSGAAMREARLSIASPSGNGEVWTASTRWWSGRPRVSLALALPTLGRWTGLWQMDAAWERQRYAVGTGDIDRERRHAAMSFADWRSANTRYEIGAALDRWNNGATHVSIAASVERRFALDHFAIVAETSATAAYGTGRLSARWRSSRAEFTGITVATTLVAVTSRTPLDLRPGGDTGVVRSTLLRAHPLLNDGVIDASRLHQTLAHATIEFQRPLKARPLARFAWAAFLDATPHDVDAGAGLRLKLPGAPGALRVDLARGLGDGRVALSAAWQPAW
jgi:predicted double-glycine peptidase